MAYKIVFFDIDGTLLDEEKQVPQDAAEAIRALKANGIEPVIATGRAPYFFKPLAEQLGIDSFVSLNGAYVVYKGKEVHQRHIPMTDLEQLVRLAEGRGHALVFQGKESFHTNQAEHAAVFASVNSLKVDQPGYNPDFWRSEGIYQVFLHCERHEEQGYIETLPDLRFIRWHANAMDVLPRTGSKAEGIQALLDALRLTPADAVAFGDGLNDKEMLKLVGLGIAMGNSNEELLPFADYVTSNVDEGGVRNGLVYAGCIA
ncbi:Cof-type HAD-IIB family hydrolase [Cohnella nanjingensis]|uniref:Cof-type HAD-IIB family hydrolase n=1 Tax=Cohnella nanjingensis TaxID=1387779 RepID=A0A7X0VFQ8_9BACL|nr:Cof-type HAD-IIB family hydrolase [Cohnella nanjingensis]MBB6671543.1 Cof-type HAD-IIB family hydrolase [Cohnella nanjingensis]